MSRVIVVGGGISGLALAHRLEQLLPPVEVLVLEQRPRLGGVIETASRDGFLVECGPNAFPDANPVTLELARSLGLGGRLMPASESAGRNRFLLLGGRLRLLPNSLLSFLTSDLLSWVAKAELLAERFKPRRKSDADESIDSFARRRAGREVAATLADAFVTGILAGDPRLLSVQASFPRLAAYERDHGSVTAGFSAARKQRRLSSPASARAQTWSFDGGLGVLIDALGASLRTRPLTGVNVRRALPCEGGWRVEADGRDGWDARAVILACPSYAQAELLGDHDADLAGQIGGIDYNRVAVVALGYRREDVPHSLDGFGYLSRQRERRDVLGAQWCSSIFASRAPEGHVLMRALCGGWNRPDLLDLSDDRLVAAVRAEMARAVGVTVAPRFCHVVRWPRAIPQYFVGHLERVAVIEERVSRYPGLFVGGSAYRGVAINDCVEQAGKLAERVAGWWRTAEVK